MRERIGLLFFLIALSGCQTIVDLDVPNGYQSKLVVESQFSPDSLWKVKVERSVPLGDITEPSGLIVEDAKVIVTGEGNFRDSLEYLGNGIYQTLHDHRPIPDVTYMVQVNVDGFPEAEASSWAPPLTSKLLILEREAPVDSFYPDHFRLRFELTDRSGTNYYRLRLFQVVPICSDDGSRIFRDDPTSSKGYRRISFRSRSPSFRGFPDAVDDPTIPTLDDKFGSAFFSDQLFESTTTEFEITFESMRLESVGTYLMLIVTVLNNDLFAFERTLSLHDIFLDVPNITYMKSVEIHTNVRNGLGIFAGYTSDTYRFDAEGNEWTEDVLGIGTGDISPCME